MRYTKKLAATIPATMIIVIITPFLVVLFLSSGGFYFLTNTSNEIMSPYINIHNIPLIRICDVLSSVINRNLTKITHNNILS